jgi:hypothetical protein
MTEHHKDRTQLRSIIRIPTLLGGNLGRVIVIVVVNVEPQLSMIEMRSNVALLFALVPEPGLSDAFLDFVLAPAAHFGKLTHSTLESLFDFHAVRHPFTVPPSHGLFQVGV